MSKKSLSKNKLKKIKLNKKYSVKQISEILDRSPRTIREHWIKEYQMPIDDKRKILGSDLIQFINSRLLKPKPEKTIIEGKVNFYCFSKNTYVTNKGLFNLIVVFDNSKRFKAKVDCEFMECDTSQCSRIKENKYVSKFLKRQDALKIYKAGGVQLFSPEAKAEIERIIMEENKNGEETKQVVN